MKTTTFIPLMLLVIFCVSACDSHGQNKRAQKKEKKAIENVAYNYLDAMGNYRIKDAYPYATPETQNNTLRFVEDFIMPKTDTNYLKSETPAKITINGITLTSDTTAEVLFHKSTPSSERNNILQLVKRNGKWMANVQIDVPNIFNIEKETEKKLSDTNKYKKLILMEADPDKVPTTPRQ